MMKRFASLFVGLCLAFAPHPALAVLKAVQTAGPPSNVSITGGTITGTNVPYTLSHSAIPFISAPTGTMANNGAVTFGTALPIAYSGGAWIYYPAGAVAAGVPAAASWLWTVMSSTTVGTVYNSTYTSGAVALGTTTAFVTTGPGAFVGDTAEEFGPQITLPANSLGANGSFWIWKKGTATPNNANGKQLISRWSGTGGTPLSGTSGFNLAS